MWVWSWVILTACDCGSLWMIVRARRHGCKHLCLCMRACVHACVRACLRAWKICAFVSPRCLYLQICVSEMSNHHLRHCHDGCIYMCMSMCETMQCMSQMALNHPRRFLWIHNAHSLSNYHLICTVLDPIPNQRLHGLHGWRIALNCTRTALFTMTTNYWAWSNPQPWLRVLRGLEFIKDNVDTLCYFELQTLGIKPP